MSNDDSINALEQTMKKIQYADFDNWLTNFALNLNDIWNENSSKDLAKYSSNDNNISISDLGKFDYFYKPTKEDPTVSIIDNYNYEIRVINGKCKNYEDDNIEIRNFTNLDFKSFLNQDNNNLDDIIIDINKIFLNSGFFFNVKSESKIHIKIIYHTEDNFTIFQNNFINFKKNCEVQLEDQFHLKHLLQDQTVRRRSHAWIRTISDADE